ncbi:transcription factor 12-like isoform X1 [Tubulanus polymorphus]|uniref:transcription factor 12-like isoform X1 n=1 Tax=Tubulanus polymorphus TaxID=672921 RepID=UPI003DA40935
MNVATDKELSDLLDFSAMAAVIGGGPKSDFTDSRNNLGQMYNAVPGKNGPTNMDNLYHYKGVDNNWNTNNDANSNYDRGMYNGVSGPPPPNSGYPVSDNLHPFVTNDMPNLISKSSDPFSRSYPHSRDAPINSQNLIGSSVPMSPDSLSPAGKPGSPYYHSSYPNKRPGDESTRGRGGKYQSSAPKRRKGSGSVYSPSPDEFGQDSPGRYTSPKPGLYGEAAQYFMDGSHGGQDPWSSQQNGVPSNPHYHPQSSFTSLHHSQHEMGYHSTVSPSHDPSLMQTSGLPPMSSFRGQQMVPSSQPYQTSSPSVVNGADMISRQPAPPGGGGGGGGTSNQQTGDALGKALASIYPTEHSNSYGSNPSTPVSSPPPMSVGGPITSQWSRPNVSSQTTTSSQFESHLHSLNIMGPSKLLLDDVACLLPDAAQQSRMEERLDDAIHVLRNHAEGQLPGLPGHLQGLLPPHSNGLMSYPSHMPNSAHHLPPDERARASGAGLDHVDGGYMPPSSTADKHTEQTTDGSIKVHVEKIENHRDDNKSEKDEKPLPKTPSTPSNGSKRPRKKFQNTENSSSKFDEVCPTSLGENLQQMFRDADSLSNHSRTEPDEDESPETKAERERLRRQANNARERIRVRDINESFKELGHMVTIHTGSTQPLTKLMILQQAVNIITQLEQQVRERNLNPKAACLKRREEEKSEELPGRQPQSMNPDELAQHAAMAGYDRHLLHPEYDHPDVYHESQ